MDPRLHADTRKCLGSAGPGPFEGSLTLRALGLDGKIPGFCPTCDTWDSAQRSFPSPGLSFPL